jgi:fermentation-respiration switch protein FrsA (DUF1100 family)
MKKIILVLALFASINIMAQDISGAWYGALKIQGMQLRLVFNISKTDNGYSATMDSPDQGAKGIPTTSTTFVDGKLKIEIAMAKIEYNGELNDEVIVGTFKQNGMSFPMDLSKQKIEKKTLNRPQEPKAPFTYYSEDITFENKKANITLAGTLTLPKKDGNNYPVVVLISGSGPQNRNEELMGHKPFLVIADYLTQKGIAVLRYDDRGTAQSKGNFATATTADFADDAEAAVAYLKTRTEINSKKIGLIGHSEGGMIAPLVASRNKDVNFIVMLAGTGLQGSDLLLLQKELIERASGVSEADIQKGQMINKGAFNIVLASEIAEKLTENLNAYFSKIVKETPAAEKSKDISEEKLISMQTNEIATPWMSYFITYNPTIALSKVKCAVLAVNGEKDLQVPPKQNLDAIKAALNKAGNKKYTIKQFAGLNHLFQECKNGLPTEYAEIEQTFSPVALDEITQWILNTVK